MRRASVALDGGGANNNSTAPRISHDGRFVTFQSFASNLVSGDDALNSDVFVTDVEEGSVRRVRKLFDAGAGFPTISGDGRYVAYMVTPAFFGVSQPPNQTWL